MKLMRISLFVLVSAPGVTAFIPLLEFPQRSDAPFLQERARRQQWDEWTSSTVYEEEEDDYYEDVPPWLRQKSQAQTQSAAPVMWHPEYSPETDSYLEYSTIPEDDYTEDYEQDYEPYYPPHPPLLQDQYYYEQDDTIYPYQDSDRALAAGLGTAALGFFLGGPLGAAVLGFSSAYAAEKVQEHTIVGDSARAIGEVALAAGKKGAELNRKHDVLDRALHAAEDAWEMAKDLDREHQIVQKAKDVAIYGGTATLRFVQEHNLVERSVKGLGQGFGWVSQRVAAGSLDGVKRDRASLRDAAVDQPKIRPERRPKQPQLSSRQPQRRQRNLMPTQPYDDSYDDYYPMENRQGKRRQREEDFDDHRSKQTRRRRPKEDYLEDVSRSQTRRKPRNNDSEGEHRPRPPPRKPRKQPDYY